MIIFHVQKKKIKSKWDISLHAKKKYNIATFKSLAIHHASSRYRAISRRVVEKSARDSPKRYCGWF